MSKSLDEIRDELANTRAMRQCSSGCEHTDKVWQRHLIIGFQDGFDASTKIHQEKYDALMREAMKLRDKLSLIYTEGPISTNAFLVNEARCAICPFDKFLQELEK